MAEKLKPCPFCGGEAELRVYSAELQFVQCTACLAGSTAFHTGKEAVTAWNKRWTLSSRLRKVLKEWLRKWLKD